MRFGRDNRWHRTALDGMRHSNLREALVATVMTACERPLADNYYATREPSYEGPLCTDGCFTPYELRLAAELAAEQRAADEARHLAFHAEAEARESERQIIREEARQRVDIAIGRTPSGSRIIVDGDDIDDGDDR